MPTAPDPDPLARSVGDLFATLTDLVTYLDHQHQCPICFRWRASRAGSAETHGHDPARLCGELVSRCTAVERELKGGR